MSAVHPEAVAPSRTLGARGFLRHAPLAGLLALAAVLYLYGLSRNGSANTFYAAAVEAGTRSWKALFFGSFDSSNYITVDKPPASLWVMALSGRLFGFSSWSMLAPQALEGVLAVWLLYATVRRWFSQQAALLAGLVLAVTPVAVLMFRFNNPDALLVLLSVASAYALTRALEKGSPRWLALCGAALGLAFLAKMFQAFLVVPGFALVYLAAAPVALRQRVGHLLAGGVALVLSAGWWVAAVDLWPAASRPYIGGSNGNSILDLIFGYNGLGRIDGNELGSGGAGGGPQFSGSTGLLRLFGAEMGGQISWLLPSALVVLAAGLWVTRRSPRTDRRRAALLLWGTWLVASGLVYSFASGIIHPYYTNTLAPAIGALVGIGAVAAWRGRDRLGARIVLAAILLPAAVWAWALLGRTPDWHPWLRTAILAGGIAVSAGLVVAGGRLGRRSAAALAAAGLLAGLGGSLAYTLATVSSAQAGSIVAAGPAGASTGMGGRGGFRGPGGGAPAQLPSSSVPQLPGLGGGGGAGAQGAPPVGARAVGPAGEATVSAAVTRLLLENADRYTWVAAATSSNGAAPYELATHRAVMAIGGFSGSDGSTTLAAFEKLVAAGRIHWFVASGGGGPGGGNGVAAEIASWVAAHFEAVDAGGTTLYDLTRRTG